MTICHMSEAFEKFLNDKLEYLKSKDQYRSLEVYADDYLDFSSNDYLGLAKPPSLRAEPTVIARRSRSNLPTGSTGSRLITGNSPELESLEKEIATWKKTEAALFFGSGYLANLGVIPAIAGPRDVIFSDELNHSCILEAIRLSGAKKFFYRHLDVEHLRELLQKHRGDFDKAFVITDSIFSMQGTCADLKSMIALKEDFDFSLYLDEAHATGTMASNGAGLYADLVEKSELDPDEVEIQMGTFSKACGVEGAYVAGSKLLIDYLINSARTFIYSTAPSPLVVDQVRENLQLLIDASDKRKALNDNIEFFRAKLDELGLKYTNDKTAIFAIECQSNAEALELSKKFLKDKILVKAIRPPTTPKPCLRICLHSDHSFIDLQKVTPN